jgi:ATP-dependent DNA helicase
MALGTITYEYFLLNIPCFIFYLSFLCYVIDYLLSRFDFSGKGNEEHQEETEEKRRVHVVSKLHAILRPFLLRRMKEDVEQMLPRKKEIIIYANMTEHQKQIQEHLVEKTFDDYLHEESDIGMLA